ncbi:acyl carrier protein [Planctomycetes bacterium Pan216]|uniref:Acyl carrier protein n=1 Tax=Kolteria novifilia TaxID=2527975 RepID=A0A518BB37_9BACT|nr:acyl carrier protein [Planctomycetes bacterium Pan216]
MTEPEVRQAVLDIIERIAPDEELGDINDAEPIREQVDLDSMDFLDIVMELRKIYGVEVPEEDYVELSTLERSVAYLSPRMQDKELAAKV